MNKKSIFIVLLGVILFSGNTFCMNQDNFRFQKPVGCSKPMAHRNVENASKYYNMNPWVLLTILRKNIFYSNELDKRMCHSFEKLRNSYIRNAVGSNEGRLKVLAGRFAMSARLSAASEIGKEIMLDLHKDGPNTDLDGDVCMQ